MDEATLFAYCAQELDATACEAVEAWAAAAPQNRKRLEQVYYAYRLSLSARAYEEANTEAALRNFRARLTGQKTVPAARSRNGGSVSWRRVAAVAASFVLGLLLSGGLLTALYGPGTRYEVQTRPGQRSEALLPDGSRVWLNGATQLVYRSGPWQRERRAELEGEAYFEVAHQGHKPFVVHGQGVRTRVLGTRFNVRSRSAEHKVATTLLEGSVRMYRGEGDARGRLLRAGETLVIDTRGGGDRCLAYPAPEEVLLWRDGELRFEARTLAQIAQSLEKVYNVEVVFASQDLREKRFTGRFQTDSPVEEILETLSLTQHFRYRSSGGRIEILPYAAE